MQKKIIIRKNAKERRSIIIDAVLDLADNVGPGSISTAMIAKRAGLTDGGIFRHFQTKQDVWIAVANEIERQARQYWSKPLGEKLEPKKKIEQIVKAQFKLLSDNPAILTIMFSYELQRANSDLRMIFTDIMQTLKKYIRDEFVRAGYDEQSAQDYSFLIIALIQGVGMRWSVSQRNFDLVREGTRLVKMQLDLFDFDKKGRK